MKIYTVYDKAAETYGTLLLFPSNEVAIRNFRLMCNQDDTMYHLCPEDFSLVYLGEFNTETAEFSTVPLFCIANAKELISDNA